MIDEMTEPAFVFMMWYLECLAVADPGFPRGGGANHKGGGRQPIIWPIFSQKLHENEEILGRGGARPSRPPLDPPLLSAYFYEIIVQNI